MLELIIVVAILSILALVAVPSFIKYMRRAKTAEAIKMIEVIHDGAARYFARGKVQDGSGAILGCQFPSSTALSPDVTGQACCEGGSKDADDDGRCDIDAGLWDNPSWNALDFAMTDQGYFGYQFISSGTANSSQFTARAMADLDCDNTTSTFERYGYAATPAAHAECAMRSSHAYYVRFPSE